MTTVEKAARWLCEVYEGEHDFNDLDPRDRAHYMECAQDLIVRLYGGPL